MSSDSELERLLREARGTLAGPDAASFNQARAAALAAVRRRPPRRLGVAAVLGVVLVVAVGLGVSLGALIAPRGIASSGPVGLGFLPERGWDVLQTGAQATQDRPAVAIASNGAFAPDDAARGVRNSSGLPYSTLLDLSPDGIVIVARFTLRDPQPNPSSLHPSRRLPLSLRDASPSTAFGVQVRPERPLGQYLLRAGVNGHNVELEVYFGTPRPSPALIEDAQRQIDRLVVNPRKPSASVQARAFPLRPTSVRATEPKRILDRTLVCATALLAGIDAKGHRGTGRARSVWGRPAFVAVTTGTANNGGTQNPTLLDNSLAWMTAGRPSPTSTLIEEGLPIIRSVYPIRTWGTLAINGRLCRSTKAPVTLGVQGLQARALGPFEENFTCATPRRVVLRVRAVLDSPAVLRSYRTFARTTIPVRQGQLAVQTESGKRLAYAEVSESGKARLFTARSCLPRQ